MANQIQVNDHDPLTFPCRDCGRPLVKVKTKGEIFRFFENTPSGLYYHDAARCRIEIQGGLEPKSGYCSYCGSPVLFVPQKIDGRSRVSWRSHTYDDAGQLKKHYCKRGQEERGRLNDGR